MIVALLFAKGSLLKFQLYSLEAAASASVVKRHTAIVVGRIALLLWHSHKADQNIRVIDYFLLANIILETVFCVCVSAPLFSILKVQTRNFLRTLHCYFAVSGRFSRIVAL